MNLVKPNPGAVRPKGVWVIVAAALLATLTACSGSVAPKAESNSPSADVDLTGQWRLASAHMQGRDFKTTSRADLGLVVSDAGNQAHAGCMVAALAPKVSGDSVRLAITSQGNMMSCPPTTKQGNWDQPYLDAVAAVVRGERSGATLTLTGPNVRLTYIEVKGE